MIEYAGKNVLVVGMARTGLATAEFLLRRWARVTINDSKGEAQLGDSLRRARAMGAVAVVGCHPETLFLGADLIVVSPGVPLTIAPLRKAIEQGIPIVGDIELAFREMQGHVAAITGSNGKTTTTALTGAILAAAGLKTIVAGNIGTPLISMLDEDSPDRWYVCELSSFQLEAVDRFRPRIAAILNITPDHLDRYDSIDAYADAKRRIYAMQQSGDALVLNGDDPMLAAESAASDVYYFSRTRTLTRGCWLEGDSIRVADDRGAGAVITLDRIPLKGTHNIENVMAAALMSHLAGADLGVIGHAIETFTAVPHRLQLVATIGGAAYYNDSKATNVDATIKAIESFPGKVIIILGGKDKGGSYQPLVDLCRARVKTALLIGQAADKIAAALAGACPIERATTLEAAVGRASVIATPGDTVLLAPACASFDMFRDFEHRGDVFMAVVRRLAERKR